MHRTRFVPIASLALLAAATRPTHAQTFIYVSAYATCAGPDSLYVIWTAVDAAADPNAYPEFVGYDVMRRPMGECVDYVPANAEIIPRVIGTTTHYFGELTPEAGRTFEYRVRAVDQNRQQVFIPGFCSPCESYVNCPPLEAPITIGTLVDIGAGFIYVTPCPGSCYPFPYLDPKTADQLRPYAGTSTAFRFFGTIGCGSLEGCSIGVDRWEFTTCVTPVTTRSWGQLKTIYR